VRSGRELNIKVKYVVSGEASNAPKEVILAGLSSIISFLSPKAFFRCFG
jgi:hypothetical protein